MVITLYHFSVDYLIYANLYNVIFFGFAIYIYSFWRGNVPNLMIINFIHCLSSCTASQ